MENLEDEPKKPRTEMFTEREVFEKYVCIFLFFARIIAHAPVEFVV